MKSCPVTYAGGQSKYFSDSARINWHWIVIRSVLHILLIASLVIVFLTLMQHTHGQGLSGAINGSMGGANNARLTPADQMLAKTTRIAGIVFFVVAILACLFAGRLAG